MRNLFLILKVVVPEKGHNKVGYCAFRSEVDYNINMEDIKDSEKYIGLKTHGYGMGGARRCCRTGEVGERQYRKLGKKNEKVLVVDRPTA